MPVQAQTELRPENKAARIAGFQSGGRVWKGICAVRWAVLTTGLVLTFAGSRLQAEEKPLSTNPDPTFFELSTPLKSRWSMTSLLLGPVSEAETKAASTYWPEDKFTSEIVARAVPRRQVFVERSLELMHVKMRSHYAYDGFANLQTGYGSFFPDDSIGRSRTNGAGLVDTDWFYLKMNFRF
jgi:hypothetical protein